MTAVGRWRSFEAMKRTVFRKNTGLGEDYDMATEGWALITGASTGIGRELASLAAEGGRDVVLVARSATRLEQAAEEIRAEYGVRAAALPMDLTEPGAPERLHAATGERGMEVDFLVNNAGFGMSRRFADVPLAVQRSMIGLNLSALAELCHLYLPGMLERGRGRILNVGSGGRVRPGPRFHDLRLHQGFRPPSHGGARRRTRGHGSDGERSLSRPGGHPVPGNGGHRGLLRVPPPRTRRSGIRGAGGLPGSPSGQGG